MNEPSSDTPVVDAAFQEALKGKPDDWALRAVAGYTMRVHTSGAADRKLAHQHGLSRALTRGEREAWTFGFTWPDRFS